MSFSGVDRRVGVKAAWVVALCAILLALAGCDVTSINALYDGDNDPDLALEPSLTGTWRSVDQKCTTVLTITAKDGAYDLQSVERGEGCQNPGRESRQLGHLVKLDSHYFLDIEATGDQVCETCLATHWIALAEFDDQRFAMTPIDSDGLGELMQAGIANVSVLPEDPDALLPDRATTLTSRSKDLKNFCRLFATDRTLFKPDSTFAFERNQAPGTAGQALP